MKQSFTVGLAILLTGAASLRGQSTTVDLTKQGRIEKGAQLAAHCAVGQLYIYTPAPAGANLYLCSATDVWSSIGGAPLGGDAAGAPSNATVRGIQGRPVDPAAPANRDVLRWDAAAGKWMPEAESPYSAGAGVAIAGSTIAVEDAVVPVYYAGAGAPTILCVPGRDFYVDSTAGALYFCKSGVGGWQAVSLPGHVHPAGDIASGTLAAGRLPSGVVQNGQANDFGAGQTQSVGHDSSAAGLRLRPAEGDPAGAQDGDVWYNMTTGKFRRRQNGVAMDWDIAAAASAALVDQANTFTGGMRQSVSHDGTNAGLRIVPAAGDPASAQDGDVWYNMTTGKFRRRQNGVAMDWDITATASAALLDQANTFTGGMRQSVSHDGTNAGLRIVPVAGDPASAQDGDVWYNMTTGKFRRRQNGVAMDWDIAAAASAALVDQANTFTGGMRQSVSHDGTNAGLRIVPVAGDPAGAQDGDVWYNMTTGKFRRRQNGVAMDWDIAAAASAALVDQANTFTGGMRQSVSHDTTNAGLRIVPATGDPASAQDGDVWYNMTTGKFRRRQNGANADWDNGGSGKSFNPHDTSSFWMVEDFTFRGAYVSTNYGQYGWYNEPISAGCGSAAYQSGIANHPSMVTLVTGAGTNAGCSAQLDGGNVQTYFASLAALTWEARWTVVPDATYLAGNFILRSGLGNTTHNPALENAIQVRIDPAASGNIQYDLVTAGTTTATLDSTLAYDAAATSYTFRLRADGSKVYFSVSKNGAAFSTERTLCPSGCDMTAALPTFTSTPFTSLVHGPTADSVLKRVYLDRFSFDLSGLSR